MYKQLIIARRDLNMSPGKLAAQVAHAAMAPFMAAMRRGIDLKNYKTSFYLEPRLYDEWINDAFTKVVCGARSLGKLLKAVEKAKELGMQEGHDFFIIRDLCRTELEPEGNDGRVVTCVGFIPMDAEIIDKIGKDFHLY